MTWQEAMREEREAAQEAVQAVPSHIPQALILNDEGSVEWNYRKQAYEVQNTQKQQCHSGLTEDQVECALQELGIQNTNWH